MAEAMVSLAVETLRDLLLEEGRFLVGVAGEVKALQNQLKEIKCFLKDADRKQHKSETVRNSIVQIRDLAYRAEDVILDYAVRVSSDGRRRRRCLKKILDKFPFPLRGCYSLHQIGSEIADIKSELARVTKSMQDYGVRCITDEDESSVTIHNQIWRRKTFPNFEIEDCFVGKEEELKRVDSLLIEDEQHRVISLWGMGGIGKTTVAKKVYCRMIEAKNKRFDSFAWVCVTQQCMVRQILEDILKQLNPQKREGVSNLSDTQLIEQLCEIQTAKRCMIVLDDLWEISHWDGLKHAFLVRNLQSKILVTTRNQKVANVGFSLELGLLNMNDSWELLKKKAFPHNKFPEFASLEDLQRIGKEMVRRCGYLPLAISLLGGVLSKKNSIKEWELVNENINASIYRGEGHDEKENQISGVLNLSYEDLPYCLKPCFLYLGRLREDETIYAPDLYRMWIAQGMITDDNIDDNTLTDTAELYLTELASRSIVQVEVEDVIPKQKYNSCKLHDVVRELCLSMGKKEDFVVQILDYQGGNGQFSTLLDKALSRAKSRHLTVHFKGELELEIDDHTTTSHTSNHLRSLEILSDVKGKAIEFPPPSLVDFRRFKLLRGLVIFGFKFAERKLPKGITDLVHLRYLRLRKCELDSLPKSISNLAYLDTLDLFQSMNVRIPDVFKKMPRIKHLLLPIYDKETIGNYRLILDEGLEGLESLIGFDSLVHELKCIKRMKNLRRFSASVSNNESLSAITDAISTNWNKLAYCTVSIKPGCELTTEKEGLMKLKQSLLCQNLYYLRICVKLGKALEDSIAEIIGSKIVRLSMLDCEVEDDPMGILGKLPLLRELYLGSMSFVGEAMTSGALSFPKLKKIGMNRLPSLREWRVEKGAMPIVSEINLRRCPCLDKVPDGFSCILSLQTLEISGMPRMRRRVLASASGEGVDFHKVRHVSSLLIK